MAIEVEVREAGSGADSDEIERVWGRLGTEAGHTLLIAWAGNRPVGRLEVRWRGSKHDHIAKRLGRVPEICRMWVAEQFRGHGIAGELLAAAKQMAHRRGDDRVGLAVGVDNLSALAAYEKAEFARIGLPRFDSPFGHEGSHTVVYMTASTTAEEPESSRATA